VLPCLLSVTSRLTQRWQHSSSSAIKRLLAPLSACLLVGFAAAVVLDLLPPQLLDPAWQWRISGVLIDNAPVAAVGLGLLHLAAYLDPGDQQLARRVHGLHRWAAAAALGFVLLIPLQAGTVVRGLGNANLMQSRQLRQMNQKLAALREKIQSAPDLASLQSRIPVDLASTVGPEALQQPLTVLRAQLLSVLDVAQRQASSNLSSLPTTSLWPLIKRSLRVLVSAPAYAVAFAAMSVRAKDELSLLDRLLRSWSLWRTRKGLWAQANTSNAEYLRQLRGEED